MESIPPPFRRNPAGSEAPGRQPPYSSASPSTSEKNHTEPLAYIGIEKSVVPVKEDAVEIAGMSEPVAARRHAGRGGLAAHEHKK